MQFNRPARYRNSNKRNSNTSSISIPNNKELTGWRIPKSKKNSIQITKSIPTDLQVEAQDRSIEMAEVTFYNKAAK